MIITDQSLFDQTVRHLRSMPGPSRMGMQGDDQFACAYRGQGGRRCSVGFWIDDDHYLAHIEGVALPTTSRIADERHSNPVILALRFYPTDEQLKILKRLQEIHDSAHHGAAWHLPHLHSDLRSLCEIQGLNSAVLDEFTWI